MKKIYLFTLKECYKCKLVKEKLIENNLEFTDIDTIEHIEIWNNLTKQINSNIVPIVFLATQVNDEAEGIVFVPIRDYDTEDELIAKIKNNL